MKAPKKLYEGRYTGRQQWTPPDDEWLYEQYWRQEKSSNQIAKELSCRPGIVLRWLSTSSVRIRTYEECDERHSLRMSGEGNPAYVNGTDRGASSKRCRNALWDSEIPEECSFCGASVYQERLEAHHKNHNRGDDSLGNLCWLCRDCHKLETHVWRLLKQDKIDLECEGRTMVIRFKYEHPRY